MNCHQPILFSFDIISLAFVSAFDPDTHFLLDSPSEGTFKVIKNGKMLQLFFQCIQKVGAKLICYSTKKYNQTAPILTAVNPKVKWIYIQCNKMLPSNVTANRALLTKLQNGDQIVTYGEGLTGCQGKEELRLAVCSALRLDVQASKRQIIIYENNTQQLQKLKQHGYRYIYPQLPTTLDEFVNIVNLLQKQNQTQAQANKYKQFRKFVSEAPTLEDPKLLRQIKDYHYFQNTKNVTLSSGLDLASSPPTFRTPNSNSICSIVFKYLGDKQLYIASADLPCKVGGELYHAAQENKILCSAVLQTLYQKNFNYDDNYGYLCIPSYLSAFNMKQATIKSYNKAKAHFFIRPYLQNIKTISEMLTIGQQQQQAYCLLKTKKINGKQVKGLGRAIAISLLCSEQLQTKGLFEVLTLYQDRNLMANQQSKLNNKDGLDCCRVNFGYLFNKLHINIQQSFEGIQINLLSKSYAKIKVSQMHEQYVQEIRSTLMDVNDNLPLIQAIFNHYIWSTNKSNQFQIFSQLLLYYIRHFKCDNTSNYIKQLNLTSTIKNVAKLNPKFINYLIANNQQCFYHFTRPSAYGFNTDMRNPYQIKMYGTQNFIIFGQCFPIFTFIKWVKNLNSNVEVSYLSLLHNKKEVYQRRIKIAKSQKKNILFIVDHCQIEEAEKQLDQGKSITNLNWGLRTVFVYRLKLGSCKKLKILYDPLLNIDKESETYNSKLFQSQQQVFKTIIEHLPNKSEYVFENYERLISIYIRNKWLTFGQKAGISEEEIIKNRLKKLVKCISQNHNRLSSILKDKQFNNFQLYLDEPNDFHSLNSSRQISLTLSSDSGTAAYKSSTASQKEKSDVSPQLQHLKYVPKSQIILYCLPIYICNQRVELLHDIHEYMCAFYLYQAIIEGTWNGNLQGDQLTHFAFWYPRMPKKQIIQIQLRKFLEFFATQRPNKDSLGPTIMGSSDNFTDCLELMRKIQIKSIFCKLDQIYNFASGAQNIFQVADIHGIVAKHNKIYIFHESAQGNRYAWKSQCLEKQKQIKQEKQQNQKQGQWKFISAHQIPQIKIKIINFIKLENESGKIEIIGQNIWLKQIRIGDQKILSSSIFKVNIQGILKQDATQMIVKCARVSNDKIIIVFESGKVLACKLNIQQPKNQAKLEQGIIVFNIYELFNLEEMSKQFIHRIANKMQIEYRQVDANCSILTVAFLNLANAKKQHINKNNTNCHISKHPCIYYAVISITPKQDHGPVISIIHRNAIVNQYQIKTFRTTIISVKENNIDLQFIGFEMMTDCMLIWNTRIKRSPHNYILANQYSQQLPTHKRYRVENEPADVCRTRNTILVVSNLGFAKRMQLDSIAEEQSQEINA